MMILLLLLFSCIPYSTGFAAAISIVTSSILCMAFFNFNPTWGFIAGASLVNYSVYLYGLPSNTVHAKVEAKSATTNMSSDSNKKVEQGVYYSNLNKV